ncbi:MAG: hypothetical protein VX984_03415 [Thermodesulfobacteriota bacterium]|mgnify:CR=1 FL=1|nr:hypothetical protein [Thermodesulfobacteriota bacterium]MEE2975217.1 hypothetical protein [Thermodesulfobacteriota bacterium]|tara:strand:- start:140 stop:487 length:348 start_codon:yes stop_codon:yes gene_type:complete
MEMKLWAETPRLQTGWGQGSSMMRTSAGTKTVPVRLLITEIRDGEEKNVRILHKLSSIFNSIVEKEEDIELSKEEYGLRIVKTVKGDKYNIEMWDQWVIFSRKIYDNIEKIIKGF